MIRSRSIPTVLSRITGDGIHAVLLIDADGELLGSYGSPPAHPADNNGISTATANEKVNWPLDAASIGALISEVAGDYRRMGEELLLLDPLYDSQGQADGVDGDQDDVQSNQDGPSSGVGGAQQAGGKNGKEKNLDSGTNLKSLVIELDYGVVGVASAGPNFYVIALADSNVQHGALAGRLRTMGSNVGEALSQLD